MAGSGSSEAGVGSSEAGASSFEAGAGSFEAGMALKADFRSYITLSSKFCSF